MTHEFIAIVFAVLMLPGLVGIVVPFLPGVPYMMAIAFIAALFDGFVHLHGWELALLAGITAVSLLIDHGAGAIGARIGGASPRSAGYGLAGLILGSIMLPPFGGVLLMAVAISVHELAVHGDEKRAVKAATGSLAGYMGGVGINLLVGLFFILLFIILAWK